MLQRFKMADATAIAYVTIYHASLKGIESSKGCFRNYPQGGAHFFRPLHPQDTHGVKAPRPPAHVSALINAAHYGSNMP